MLDPIIFYWLCGGIFFLKFSRQLWFKLYPPCLPNKFRNNSYIEQAYPVVERIQDFISNDSIDSVSISEEELNSVCKLNKSKYHFSIKNDKLFAHQVVFPWLLSWTGYIFVTWQITFYERWDNLFKRNLAVESVSLVKIYGGSRIEDEFEDEDCLFDQGKLFTSIKGTLDMLSTQVGRIKVTNGILIFMKL